MNGNNVNILNTTELYIQKMKIKQKKLDINQDNYYNQEV